MKSAGIISVGNELLTGRITNTNAAYLAEKLLSAGLKVTGCHTVADEIDSIKSALQCLAGQADIILITGGLGPTADDLTREALAVFLGVRLELRGDLLEDIRRFFVRADKSMPDTNKKQAYLPAGSEALINEIGTAPGIMAQKAGRVFFALPGVPAEMKIMFENAVLPKLQTLVSQQHIVIRKLKCFGTGESAIAQMLGSLMKRRRNPQINCTAEYGVISLWIIAQGRDRNSAEQMARNDEKVLREKLGNLVFGTDEQTLARIVGTELALQNKTIAVAESCTAGLLAKILTDIPGASRYFTQGWITYSNKSKTSRLGVQAELIERFGAVSRQVAEAMAVGARQKAGTDYAIAITGIAGPAGATEQKPAGLVYICMDSQQGCRTQGFVFCGDRDLVRHRAANTALNMLRLRLKN